MAEISALATVRFEGDVRDMLHCLAEFRSITKKAKFLGFPEPTDLSDLKNRLEIRVAPDRNHAPLAAELALLDDVLLEKIHADDLLAVI